MRSLLKYRWSGIKSTQVGSAKFASKVKILLKDLAMLSVVSKNAYVAKISIGANYEQAIKAFREAKTLMGQV